MSCIVSTHPWHELCHDEEALFSVSWVRLVANTQVGDNPLVSQCAQHVVLLLKALDGLCKMQLVWY